MNSTDLHSPVSDESAGKPTLLVIDDEPALLESISEALQQDFRVFTEEDGMAGVERALELVPDLVITDVNMPLKNGFAVCVELKNNERTSHIPLIMLSALTDEVSRITGLQLGADDYLGKPFNVMELQLRIGKLLGRKARFREEIRVAIDTPASGTAEMRAKEAPLGARLRELILLHFREEDFGVDRLGELVGIERRTLERRLGKEMNMTPNNLIKEVKLMLSKKYLEEERDLEIKQIAAKAGFSTPQKFTLDFTDYFGLNPSVYRQNWARLG